MTLYERFKKNIFSFTPICHIHCCYKLATGLEEKLDRQTKEDMISYAVVYGEFMYQASSWKKERRVVCKIEKPANSMEHRFTFIVTNMTASCEFVIGFYCKRGQIMSAGAIIRQKVNIHRYRILWLLVALVITSFLSFMEISRLLSLTKDRFYIDISIFNWMPAVIIFLLALKIDGVHSRGTAYEIEKAISPRMIRKMSDSIYIFHPAIIWLVTMMLG